MSVNTMAELSWGSLGRTIMAGIMPSEIILQVNALRSMRIRIFGSVPLTNGSGCGSGFGSCSFCQGPSRCLHNI